MSTLADDQLIATAAHAFGGHISRGLLRRARAALNRRCDTITKNGRAAMFDRIKALPPLWRGNPTIWAETAEIIYACRIWADLGDEYDYHSASRSWSCLDRVNALRHFVTKYGGKRLQAKTLPNLSLRAPTI